MTRMPRFPISNMSLNCFLPQYILRFLSRCKLSSSCGLSKAEVRLQVRRNISCKVLRLTRIGGDIFSIRFSKISMRFESGYRPAIYIAVRAPLCVSASNIFLSFAITTAFKIDTRGLYNVAKSSSYRIEPPRNPGDPLV